MRQPGGDGARSSPDRGPRSEVWRSRARRASGRDRRTCGPGCGAGRGRRLRASRCRGEQRGLRRCRTVRAVELGEIQGGDGHQPNLYGVVNVTRAAIAIMRKQKSGCILQISSLGGRLALPGSTAYHAAKWAVGGFTESLAQELAPFGVKVCALEPGGMRTNWGTRAHKDLPELLPDYEPSVGAIVKALHSLWGKENSDPAKVAQVILRLADSDRLPAHLLIGSDAVRYAAEAEAARAADANQWRETSVSTDVDAPGALPALQF